MKKISCLYCMAVISGSIVITACQNPEQQVKAENATALTELEQEITLEQMIEDWPSASKEAANAMIEKYGQPNGVTPDMLIWKNNGPWKKTILYKEEVQHNFPVKHTDILEQFIDYKVPVSKFSELAAFDGSVTAMRTRGEMSAQCDNEHMNFLAINLANEVASEQKTVEEAREFYAKTAMEFMAGNSSPYTEKLIFDIPKNTADPGERMILEGIKETVEDVVN